LMAASGEFIRAREFWAGPRRADGKLFQLTASGPGNGPPGCQAVLAEFLNALAGTKPVSLGKAPTYDRPGFKPQDRLKRQLDEMTEYTQHLMREGEYTRKALWAK